MKTVLKSTGLALSGALVALALVAAPASAKPHLRDTAIDNNLMFVAIADSLRKDCGNIGARMIKAYGYLEGLKKEARKMGYTDEEIEDYVTSKAEKDRMRQKATAYLAQRGVNAGDKAAFCAYGQAEIDRGSVIGSLLRKK